LVIFTAAFVHAKLQGRIGNKISKLDERNFKNFIGNRSSAAIDKRKIDSDE